MRTSKAVFRRTNLTVRRAGAAAAARVGIAAVFAGFLLSACMSPDAGVATTPAEGSVEEGGPMQVVGVWDGSLKVQGAEIRIIVKFLTDPTVTTGAPVPAATMDIPAQMAYGLPLSNVSASGSSPGATIHFELATSGPTLIADGEFTATSTISGTFTQGAASGEIALSRLSDLAENDLPAAAATGGGDGASARHGMETEVSIRNEGVVVNGTLLMPDIGPGDASSQVPLVIIVAGSGPTDRDGNTPLIPGRNDSLKLLAEGLANEGIATLRYDKRGIAGSGYESFREEDLTFGDLVNDLLAWVIWSEKRADISGVFLAGHSEGGLAVLGAVGASETPLRDLGVNLDAALRARERISGVICIAAPGRTLDEITLEQLERSLGPNAPLFLSSKEIFDAIRDGGEVPDVPEELFALFRPSVQPYLQSVIRFDPIALAAAMPQPLLVVGGVEDLQVPVSDAEALADARPDARLVIIAGMNHVLKVVPPADLASNQRAYADPSFELSEDLVSAVSEFVLGK